MIEPEGFLKKRTNLTVRCEAKSQARLDSFIAASVPLLRAVLLHPASQAASSMQGSAGADEAQPASDVEWHPAAPVVALVTDFGEEEWRHKRCSALDKISTTLENLRSVPVTMLLAPCAVRRGGIVGV